MSILSLTTDFGENEALLHILKTKLIVHIPNSQLIVYSDKVDTKNFLSVATFISRIIPHCPKDSVHLLLINTEYTPVQKYVLVKKKENYIIAPDNGVLSLIEGIENVTLIAENTNNYLCLFDDFLKIIMQLSNNQYPPIVPINIQKAKTSQNLDVFPNGIIATVVDVDEYGNLESNVHKSQFDKEKKNAKEVKIKVLREVFEKVHNNVAEVSAGETSVYFNTFNYLEIGVYQGNASTLLGLKRGALFRIIFKF